MPEHNAIAPTAESRARASVGEWFGVLLLAAIITGALGGLLYALSVPSAAWWRAMQIGALIGALLPVSGLLLVASAIVAPWLKLQITYRLEVWFGDLNNDGVRGDPGEPGLVMVTRGTEARAKATLLAAEDELRTEHVSLADMVQFVLLCFEVGTSESAQGIKPHNRSKYLEARQKLDDLGLVTWRNPQNHRLGWDIRGKQADVIKLVREHLIER